MKTTIAVISIFIVASILITGCSEAQAMPQDLATATQKIVNEVKEQDNSVVKNREL